jgi:hypothetical protein
MPCEISYSVVLSAVEKSTRLVVIRSSGISAGTRDRKAETARHARPHQRAEVEVITIDAGADGDISAILAFLNRSIVGLVGDSPNS